MKRLFWVFCIVSVLAVLWALPAFATEYDPIQTSSSVDPKALTGPQSVTVTIRIVNAADGDIQDAITLYNPAGERVESWPSLKQGASVSYTGSWNVTDEELSDGRIRYRVSYQIYDEETGSQRTTSKVVAVSISRATASAQLTADYSISPAIANEGQNVTFTYTLSNTGNVNITNVQITNPNVTDEKVNISSIPAGEKVTRAQTIVMGNKALSSSPRVTYRAEGSDTVLTLNNLAKKTLEVAQSGLTVNLVASGETEVMPGEILELTCTVENTGNLTYSDLRITDGTLGDIATGISLRPGETHVEKRSITVSESNEYTFNVTAADSTGQAIEVASNTLTVVAIDTSKLLQLQVSAETQTTAITEKPQIVAFTIRVANVGEAEGTDIVVRAGDKTVAGLAEPLAPGEEWAFAKNFEVTWEGTFEFTVTGKGEQGLTETFTTNQIVLPYLEPTPEPTAPPFTPEPVDLGTPEPTAEPESEAGGIAGWIRYIIIGLVVLLALAILFFILVRRRGDKGDPPPPSNAVDSMTMGTRRDYTGTHKNKNRASSSAVRDPLPAEDEEDALPEVSLYDQPLYGSERDLPDEDALRKAQEEAMSDRDSYEALYARPGEGEKAKRSPSDDDFWWADDRPLDDASDTDAELSRTDSTKGRKRSTHEATFADGSGEETGVFVQEVDAADNTGLSESADSWADNLGQTGGYRPLRHEDDDRYRLRRPEETKETPEGEETGESSPSPTRTGRRRRRKGDTLPPGEA